MSPKIVDKDKKRTEIAEAAMDLFARKGFENTAVREISAAAGMGKGTFYDYFADKDDILNEIARIMFDRWREMYMAELAGISDPVDRLRALLRLSVTSADEFEKMTVLYIDLWRLGIGERADSGFMADFKEFLEEAGALAAGIIETGKKQGIFRPDVDSEAMGASLIAFIDGLAFHRMVDHGRFDSDRIWRGFFETFTQGMK